MHNPVIGFLLSPLAALAIVGMYVLWGRGSAPIEFWLVGAAFSYLLMLVFGIPLHIAIKAAKYQKWWVYTIAGGLVGVTYSMLGIFLTLGIIEPPSIESLLLTCAGAASGFVWWLLACLHPNSALHRTRKSGAPVS
jgi:hypothetical protein